MKSWQLGRPLAGSLALLFPHRRFRLNFFDKCSLEVRTNRPELIEEAELERFIERGGNAAKGSAYAYRLIHTARWSLLDEKFVWGQVPRRLLAHSLSELVESRILPAHFLVLHGSAVAFGRHAALFLGERGQGKSTMATKLLERGGKLVTDDTIVIDWKSWRILPFHSSVNTVVEKDRKKPMPVPPERLASTNEAFQIRSIFIVRRSPDEPSAAEPMEKRDVIVSLLRFHRQDRFHIDSSIQGIEGLLEAAGAFYLLKNGPLEDSVKAALTIIGG